MATGRLGPSDVAHLGGGVGFAALRATAQGMTDIQFDETAAATSGVGESPSAVEPDPLIGTTLGYFEIQKRLGSGAMGDVYLARDSALDRLVAVKVLREPVSSDASLRERFFREARAQAGLQHRNVCHIYFIGEQDDRVFFAMEYLSGKSLSDVLAEQGPLLPEVAIQYCRQAAEGLREAHKQGFIHRDVKPSNLMLDHHGTVKLVDFGIVKEIDARAGDQALTVEHTILGTPLYLAPEQARGEPVDFKADMYSLGVTLHQLIAGAPPFSAPTAVELFAQHLTAPRPALRWPRSRKSEADIGEVNRLCNRMMAKQPGDRYDDYDQLIRQMSATSPDSSQPAGLIVRLLAFLIDLGCFSIAMAGIAAFSNAFVARLPGAIYLAAGLALWTWLHARTGQSFGKALLSIEVAPAGAEGRVGWRRAAIRTWVQFGPTIGLMVLSQALNVSLMTMNWENEPKPLPVLGLIAAIVVAVDAAFAGLKPNKRMLWDRVAGTVVRYKHRTLGGQAA